MSAPAAVPIDSQQRTDNDRRIFASLREISAAARNWQNELTAILDSPPSTTEAQQAMVAAQLKRKPQVETYVQNSISAIRGIFATDLSEHEWGAAVLVDLDLGWQDINNGWALDPAKAAAALDTLRHVRDKLDKIIFTCLSSTLTPDINDRLRNLDVGQPLDLNFVYGPDFPRDADLRQRLILEMVQERGVIANGCFDAQNCMIYRIAPSLKTRRKAIWNVSFFILGGLFLAAAACFLKLVIPAWPIKAYNYATLANYVALFLGAGAHVLIDALKQKRAQTKPSFTAMDDWVLWLHVHQMSVIYSIAWADLGFLLLTFFVPTMDAKFAFAAGYSIDSVTELFVTKFESVMGDAAAQLKKAAAV